MYYYKMPRRNKRRPRRRRRRPRPDQLINYGISPVPNSYRTKVRYCTSVVIDPSISSIGSHVFSANGLYDPDITGTGHQPLGFDNLMALYDHYTVLGSKLTATFIAPTTSVTTSASNVGVLLDDNSTAYTTLESIREQGRVHYRTMTVSGSSNPSKITKFYSAKKFHGLINVQDNEDYKGDSAANPAEQAYFQVFVEPVNNSYDISAVNVQIQIDYIVVFSEPKQLAQS